MCGAAGAVDVAEPVDVDTDADGANAGAVSDAGAAEPVDDVALPPLDPDVAVSGMTGCRPEPWDGRDATGVVKRDVIGPCVARVSGVCRTLTATDVVAAGVV